MDGSEWEPVTAAVLEAARGENPDGVPSAAWFKTRKGRGYGKYDNKSHGTPWPMNAPEFWAVRHEFMEYATASSTTAWTSRRRPTAERAEQARHNLEVAHRRPARTTEVVDAVSDRLIEVADLVPERGRRLPPRRPRAEIFDDPRFTDVRGLPGQPVEGARREGRQPRRARVMGRVGQRHGAGRVRPAAVHRVLGRPRRVDEHRRLRQGLRGPARLGLVRARHEPARRAPAAADHRVHEQRPDRRPGLGQPLDDPMNTFNGFWGACSTYGSFSYLKYGPMRLFCQLAQDCQLKVGKVIWVAGHFGPETAEDSRTHFGIYETGVTQLFPEGHVIDLHPWEYNEVPVVLAAALALPVPIVALHLTRPAIEIPDRAALGMASHFEAARGAYLIREPDPGAAAWRARSTSRARHHRQPGQGPARAGRART